MNTLANISQFESLQNSAQSHHQPRVGVVNWGNSAEKKWLEWAWQHPELVGYAQRLARVNSHKGFFGRLDAAPTEIRAEDPYHSSRQFYTKNPDYKGYRDALYNKDFIKQEFGEDKGRIQEYYTNMAKQELSYYLEAAKERDRSLGNVWSVMVRKLLDNNLLTEREMTYLGKNLNEVTAVIPWIRNTIKQTGQFRGTKFNLGK